MAITVETVITRVKRIFKEADPTAMLDYVNEVHNDLLNTLPLVVDTEDLTALVAETQEYTLDEDIVRVWSVELFKSATDRRSLNPVEIPYLNVNEPLWRRRNSSDPTRFYIWRNTTSPVVGLDPKPNLTTTGGYPFIRLHVTRTATLARSSSLPTGIRSADVYVFGCCAKLAEDPNQMQFYEMKYEQAKLLEVSKFHGLNVQSKVSIQPGWIPRGGLA